MHGIMVVNQAGETVASIGWEHLEGDVAMFGGFVSAIQMFIKKISGGNEVEELRFGMMKILIGSSSEYHIITLHEAEASGAIDDNRQVVELIRENNGGPLTDGVLTLISELVSRNTPVKDEIDESVREWTESQVSKAKQSASDWGKTVF